MTHLLSPAARRLAIVGVATFAAVPAAASAQQYFTVTTQDVVAGFPGLPATVPPGFDPSAYLSGGRVLDMFSSTPFAGLHPLLQGIEAGTGGGITFVSEVDGVGVSTSSDQTATVPGVGDAPAAVIDLGLPIGMLGYANTPVAANLLFGGVGATTANASITFTPPAGTTFFGFLFAQLNDDASGAIGLPDSDASISFQFAGSAPSAYGASISTTGGPLGTVSWSLVASLLGAPSPISDIPLDVGLFGLVLDPQGSDAVIQSITFTTTGGGALFPLIAISNAGSATAVPEPGTIALLATGLAGLVGVTAARRRRTV